MTALAKIGMVVVRSVFALSLVLLLKLLLLPRRPAFRGRAEV